MAVLPSYELTDLATKRDIAQIHARIDGLEVSLRSRVDWLESRVDRLASFVDSLCFVLLIGMPLIAGMLIVGLLTR